MQTPLFPEFRARLAALGQRTARCLRQTTLRQLQEHLRECIPASLLGATEQGPNSRERTYTLALTFECFVWQMLNPGTPCREVVRQVQALLALHQLGPVSDGDSAYVQARLRLPKDLLEKALAASASHAEGRASRNGSLAGRPVKVVDGSSTQLADTYSNQQRYPQPSEQKPGCGFPVMKMLVLFSLASGAVLEVVMDSLNNSDLRLLRRLWPHLLAGDILLGDRVFGDYATLAGLPQQGVDVLARLHSSRKVDFRKGRALGKKDACFVWSKGAPKSALFSYEQWQQLPDQITVRIIRFTATIRGHRSRPITLVTTLLDPKLYPSHQLIALYLRRWRLELCLRNLKTTMGMEQLRCRTADMAEKETLIYLIAHNLIRCVMAQAHFQFEADLERISFKGTLDALRQYSAVIAQARNRTIRQQLWEDLLFNIARDLVPLRPNRFEPRALKRRPKPFSLLTKPRNIFREIPHRSHYKKTVAA